MQHRKVHPIPNDELFRESIGHIVDCHVMDHYDLPALEEWTGVARVVQGLPVRRDRQSVRSPQFAGSPRQPAFARDRLPGLARVLSPPKSCSFVGKSPETSLTYAGILDRPAKLASGSIQARSQSGARPTPPCSDPRVQLSSAEP